MTTTGKPRGRPPAALSEDTLRDELLSGLTMVEIAKRHGIGEATVGRHIAKARKKHGKGWGKPILRESDAKKESRLADLQAQLEKIDEPYELGLAVLRAAARLYPVPATAITAGKHLTEMAPRPEAKEEVARDKDEIMKALERGGKILEVTASRESEGSDDT